MRMEEFDASLTLIFLSTYTDVLPIDNKEETTAYTENQERKA